MGNFITMRPRARANLRANTNRGGNVHCKQNCFRGVSLFKTLFAEFCVKSGRKTEPWNWAVTRDVKHGDIFNIDRRCQSFAARLVRSAMRYCAAHPVMLLVAILDRRDALLD